jgi:two-component system, OmpR family, sensor histidine kinase BaeS
VARNRRDPFTLACAGLCVPLAVVPTVRAAEWISVLCWLAGGARTAAGLVRGRTLPAFLLASLAWPLAGLRGMPWLARSLRGLTGSGNAPAVLRTAIWSVLAVAVFGLLFASADALFAEWAGAVVPDLDTGSLVLRAFITVAVGGLVLATAYLGINPPDVEVPGRTRSPVQRRFEWLAPVLLVDAVFAVFLVAQASVVFGGHDYLRRTTGLTYAEYSHQGFGQLTVATALTLLVVWAAARKAPQETAEDRAWLRASLGLLCVLTLVVVVSALYRMHLYQEAYGFTQLRLLVDVFEGWLGLLLVALLVAGRALRAEWLPRLALLSGVGLLLGIAAINPDAWVAQRNVDRWEETGKADWLYLQDLSVDAVPTLESLPEDVRECALNGHERTEDDWLEWNLGRSRAESVLDDRYTREPYVGASCITETGG